MSFDAQILKLRGAANEHAAEAKIHRNDAAVDREKAAEILERVKRSERAAIESERLARDFDLLADALATGQLTKDQLRAIVTQANLDEQAPVRTDRTYTRAQLVGDDCALCGHVLAPEQATGQSAGQYGPDGEPLYAHLRCIEIAESEASR